MTGAALAAAFRHAARLIAAVLDGRNLDQALAGARLEGSLRAAVMSLVWPTLRAYGRGDFILSRLLARPLTDRTARGLLLCALRRLEERPDDAHTTVDQAVEAAKGLAHGKFGGLVNGVLRNALRRREELSTALEADETARYGHPGWWLDRLRRDHPERWREAALAGGTHPPLCLRVNRRHGDAAAYVAELAAADIAARALDDIAVLLETPVPVERLPGFDAGRVSVQDWGAQRAAGLLDLRPGQCVLDACAAPGGKTCHILETADVELLALETEASRAQRVEENLTRLRLAAKVTAVDCRRTDLWWDSRPFDRILADVPCSASGVARRHPDVKWLRRDTDVAKFAHTQAEILDALWPVLAPGGKMLYCTCSVFSEENGAQIREFARRHPDVLIRSGDAVAMRNEWQWLPDAEHDGFYYALLEKVR